MAKAAPAFQFYAAEFLMRTAVLSSEETGAYVSMLCNFLISGPIADTKEALIQAMRLGPRDSPLEKVWPEVQKLCVLTESGWTVPAITGTPETQYERRRDRLREARRVSRHTKEEWLQILASYAFCVRCGATGVPLEKDHIVPLFMGGSDGPENLQPLCRTCNCSKGGDTTDYRLTAKPSQVVS